MERRVLKPYLLAKPPEFKAQDFPMDENYMPPESLNTKNYNKTDYVWSIGEFIYYMLHGKRPFDVDKEDAYQEEYVVDKSLSHFCIDFLSRCLQKDPKNRMNFEEIKSHPFVTGETEDWELVSSDPYLKFKWKPLTECEYKFNINKLIRAIVKVEDKISVAEILDLTKTLIIQSGKINLSYKFYIEKKGKDVEFETYYERTYKCNYCNKDFNIHKFFSEKLPTFTMNCDMIKDKTSFICDCTRGMEYPHNSKYTHINNSYSQNEVEESKIGKVKEEDLKSSYVPSSNIAGDYIYKSKTDKVTIEKRIKSGQWSLGILKSLSNLDLSTHIVNGRKYEVKQKEGRRGVIEYREKLSINFEYISSYK